MSEDCFRRISDLGVRAKRGGGGNTYHNLKKSALGTFLFLFLLYFLLLLLLFLLLFFLGKIPL